jgi:hypothetical protein
MTTTTTPPRASEQADEVLISPMFLASAAFCIENYNTVAPKTRQAMIDKLLDVSNRLKASQSAALTQKAAPEAPALPIYQVQFHCESGTSAWHDASEAAYHTFMPERRRIVYASPVAAPEAPVSALEALAARLECMGVTNIGITPGPNATPEKVSAEIMRALDQIESAAPAADTMASVRPELTVWYGSMPESNGKSNFTAVLMRKGATLLDGFEDGHTIARSEYPDRVRYEADCVRYLIGENDKKPFILDYDTDKHSGYTYPAATTASASGDLLSMTTGGIDANKLEALAKEMPDECFLKGSGILKLIAAIRHLERAQQVAPSQSVTTASASVEWLPLGYITQGSLDTIRDMTSHFMENFPTHRTVMVRNIPSKTCNMPIYLTPAPSGKAAPQATVLTEAQKNTIRFAAEALEGLEHEDTAGDLREVLRQAGAEGAAS